MEKVQVLTTGELMLWLSVGVTVLVCLSLALKNILKPRKKYSIANTPHVEFRGVNGSPTLEVRLNHDKLTIKNDRQKFNELKKENK